VQRQIPSDRPEEDDRYDECICPIDMNVITDDDLRAILKDLDDGVHFTMVAGERRPGGDIRSFDTKAGLSNRRGG
jgi:hypothetical protein